jgi:hypothetical protein
METYRFTCTVGEDGLLALAMPVNFKNAEVEVAVVVQYLRPHTATGSEGQDEPAEKGLAKFPHTYDTWTSARLCTFKRRKTTSRQARRKTDERLLSYRGFPPMFEKSAGKTKAGDGPGLMHRKR